jgi:hypothetical protein
MRKVAEFFALVVALRRYVGLPELVPFANDWVAGHTGLSGVTVSRALGALRDAGVLVWDGKTLKNPKTRLYAVGGLEATAVPVERGAAQPAEELVEEPQVLDAEEAFGLGGVQASGDGAEHRDGPGRQLGLHGMDDTRGIGPQSAVRGWDDP